MARSSGGGEARSRLGGGRGCGLGPPRGTNTQGREGIRTGTWTDHSKDRNLEEIVHEVLQVQVTGGPPDRGKIQGTGISEVESRVRSVSLATLSAPAVSLESCLES